MNFGLQADTVCISEQVKDVKRDKQGVTRWSQYIAGVAASMSVFTSGAWYTWITPLLPQLLGSDSPVPMTQEEASWMVSLIEIGILFNAFPSTFIADHIGRKWSIFLAFPLLTVSFLLTTFVRNYISLCVSRTLQGIAISLPFTILPVYLGEIASPDVRGTVTSFFYISWGLGTLFSYCVGPFLSYSSLTYATYSTTVVFALCFVWLPESPYFYAMKGNAAEINKALVRLRDSATDQAIKKEEEEIQLEVKKSCEEIASWLDVVATPADRRALLLIIIVSSISYFSGQTAIETYATETFTLLGYENFPTSNEITFGFGVVGFIGSSFSLFTSDSYGRRFLLLLSSLGCVISLMIASLFFYLQTHTSVDMRLFRWVSPLAVIAYNLFVTAGMLPVSTTYTSELFSTKTRGIAASISNTIMCFSAFVVMKTYLPILGVMGVYFIYLCYCTVCLVGFILFFFLMPETKCKTFLEVRQYLE